MSVYGGLDKECDCGRMVRWPNMWSVKYGLGSVGQRYQRLFAGWSLRRSLYSLLKYAFTRDAEFFFVAKPTALANRVWSNLFSSVKKHTPLIRIEFQRIHELYYALPTQFAYFLDDLWGEFAVVDLSKVILYFGRACNCPRVVAVERAFTLGHVYLLVVTLPFLRSFKPPVASLTVGRFAGRATTLISASLGLDVCNVVYRRRDIEG